MDFTDIFKTAGSSTKQLQSSLFDFNDSTQYSFLSEGIVNDGESKPFGITTFNQPNPISEVQPAENVAQQWTRKSADHQRAWDDIFHPKNPDTKWADQFKRGDEVTPPEPPVPTPESYTPDTYKGRTNFADSRNISSKDYLRTFGRIDARAKSSPNNTSTQGMEYAY